MRILQIALITQKGNVFNVKMQIDEIVFESKEEVREKLLSVFANRKGCYSRRCNPFHARRIRAFRLLQ